MGGAALAVKIVELNLKSDVVARPPTTVVEQDLVGLAVRNARFVGASEQRWIPVATCRAE